VIHLKVMAGAAIAITGEIRGLLTLPENAANRVRGQAPQFGALR
jgi:hypothetical protein